MPLALLPAGWLRHCGRPCRSQHWRPSSPSSLREVGRPSPGWLVALLTVGALALEPVWQNLTFGQVNLLLMLAVLVDVVRPDRRWSGLLLGLAAGVKLTPLVFVVLLVLVGRRVGGGARRPRLRGHGRGGVRGGAGLLDRLLERPAGRRDPRRAAGAGPQPVGVRRPHPVARRRAPDAAVAGRRRRAVAGGAGGRGSVVACAATGCSAPASAALAMLIASPIAWSHHWVWAVPLSLALWERSRVVAIACDGGLRGPSVRVAAVRRRAASSRGPGPSTSSGNAYLICAICVVGWTAAQAARPQGSLGAARHDGGRALAAVVAGEVGVHGVPARGARQVMRQVPPRAVNSGLNCVPHGLASRCRVVVLPHQLHERVIGNSTATTNRIPDCHADQALVGSHDAPALPEAPRAG